MCAPLTRIIFVLLTGFVFSGCLESNQLDVSSQSDYGPKGLSLSSENVIEGGIAKVTFSLNYVTPRDVSFHVKSVSDGAVEGTDYLPVDRTVTIPAGSSKANLAVETFSRSTAAADRSFHLEVSELSNTELLNSDRTGIVIQTRFTSSWKNIELLNVSNQNVCVTDSVTGGTSCWGDESYAQSTGLHFNKYPIGSISLRDSIAIPSHPVKLTGNANSICAMYADGKLYCWGYGGDNNIGVMTTGAGYMSPVQSLLPSNQAAIDVTAASWHTVVVLNDGSVKAKGYGGYYALGTGTTANSSSFVSVSGLPGPAKKVAATRTSSCALLNAGTVYCWGNNNYGEVGKSPVGTPVPIPFDTGLTNIDSMASGYYHYCALASDGGVKCWGNNGDGQVGINSGGAAVPSPTTVTLPAPAVQLGVGNWASCALLNNGDVYCWGYNGDGVLGDGTVTIRTGAVKVLGLNGPAKKLSMGGEIVCVVVGNDNQLKCWGNNGRGIVLADSKNMNIPVDPSEFVGQKVKDIVISTLLPTSATSQQSICAVMDDGQTKCAGNNDYYQLGRSLSGSGYQTLGVMANLTAGTSKLIEMASRFGCVLLTTGGLQCWGTNTFGEVGNNGVFTTLSYVMPGQSPTGVSTWVTQVASAWNHSCAIMIDGTVRCWGQTMAGETGVCASNFTTLNPTTISGVSNAVNVAVGSKESCAVQADGALKCWGGNGNGLFANGTTSAVCQPSAVPVQIAPVQSVVIGAMHACALTKTGKVLCWGENVKGQLGRDGLDRSLAPVEVPELTGVKSISAGYDHTCAVLEDGGLKCWGDNSMGQLGNRGNGSARTTFAPVTPVGLGAGIQKVHSSMINTCAITSNGYPKCWGANIGDVQQIGLSIITTPSVVNDNQRSF